MKILKYAAFLLGGIVALLALAALLVVLTFDAARIKSEAIQAVKDRTQRELAIDGELELSFWPSLGVRVGRSSLSERGGAAGFAAVERARVAVAVLPLLSRQLVIDRVELDGLTANVVRGKDGRFNFDDLLAKEEKSESAPLRFDVAGIRLKGGELRYRDEIDGRRLGLTAIDLETGRLANAAQGRLAFAARLAMEAPKADLSIKLDARYAYDLEAGRYALRDLTLAASGDAAQWRGIEALLAAAALEHDHAAGQTGIEALKLEARAKEEGADLALALAAPRLAIDKAQASGATVTGRLSSNGAARNLALALSLDQVSGNAKALTVGSLKTELDLRQADTTVRGTLTTPLTAKIEERRVELPRIEGRVDIAHPAMPMKQLALPLQASLRADFAKSAAAGELATAFDDSHVKANFSLSRFQPPALAFALDVDRLDLDRYLPPKSGGKPEPDGDAKVDFSALKDLDLKGTVKIGALQVSGVKASSIRLELRVAGGRLDLSPMAAQLYEGSLAGAVTAQAQGNRLELRQTLTGVSVHPLLMDTLGRDVLEGRGNVALALATGGGSVAAMKKQLAGSARLALRDGAIKGLDLSRTLAEWKGRVAGKGGEAQAVSGGQKTAFTELSASFRIADGVARNDDLSAKSPFLRLAGAGDIDLGESRLNYLARASVVATTTGQGGKELAGLRGVTVPVRFSGPFAQLSYRLEVGDLVGEAVKAQAAEKVGEATQQLKDQAAEKLLKGGLKGLLK